MNPLPITELHALNEKPNFIQADDEVSQANEWFGSVNWASDTFNSEFADTLDTSTVAHLPDMRGNILVRDLREA